MVAVRVPRRQLPAAVEQQAFSVLCADPAFPCSRAWRKPAVNQIPLLPRAGLVRVRAGP